jgi:hypothetical protein
MGIFTLKLGKIWSQKFWPLQLLTALFLSYAAKFLARWRPAQAYNRFCRYSATERTTFVTTIFGK